MYSDHELRQLGTFQVSGHRILVADPCTKPDQALILEPAASGTWNGAIVFHKRMGDTKYVLAWLADHNFEQANWTKIDTAIAVDSGQLGIFDTATYKAYQPAHYDRVCVLTETGTREELPDGSTRWVGWAGIFDNEGIASGTALGDGNYYCSVQRKDGQIVAVKIDV